MTKQTYKHTLQAESDRFDGDVCYLGDSGRPDGDGSSRVNSLQLHPFLETMSGDGRLILRQTNNPQTHTVIFKSSDITNVSARME